MNAFVRVVELGSFTTAARSLGILKTKMSHAVVMLEQKICRKKRSCSRMVDIDVRD